MRGNKILIVILLLIASFSFAFALPDNQCLENDPSVFTCSIGDWIGEAFKISELTEDYVVVMTVDGAGNFFSEKLSFEETYISTTSSGESYKITAGEIAEENEVLYILLLIESVKESIEEDKGQCKLKEDDSFFCILSEGETVSLEEEHFYKITYLKKDEVKMTLKWDYGEISIPPMSAGEKYSVSELKDGNVEYIVEINKILSNSVEFSVKSFDSSIEEEYEVTCENGCIIEDKCLPYGFRGEGKFCSIENTFIPQYEDNLFCDNNHECKSNLCIDATCVEAGLFKKIMNWFKRIF